jgi:hypothetical protein
MVGLLHNDISVFDNAMHNAFHKYFLIENISK